MEKNKITFVINKRAFDLKMKKQAIAAPLIGRMLKSFISSKAISGFAKNLVNPKAITEFAKKVIPKSIHPEVKVLANQKMPLLLLAGGGPKQMIVDPLMESGSDIKHSYESFRAGDYSTAGGYAMSGLGNAIWGVGGLALAAPSIGAASGIGLKTVGGVLPKSLGGMVSRLGGGITAGGSNLTNTLSKVPGNQWLGLGVGGGGSVLGSIAKPMGLSLALSGGGGIGKSFGIEAKYNDMAMDPNFRDWMGTRKHDNWINNGSSVKNRVDQMRSMQESGLYERYKKSLKLKEEQYARDKDEIDRVNSYGFPVKYSRPAAPADSAF